MKQLGSAMTVALVLSPRFAARISCIYGDPHIRDRYGHQALPPVHIIVIVSNGNVRLEDVASNEAHKNLINVRANSVPNVFHLQNNLQVAVS